MSTDNLAYTQDAVWALCEAASALQRAAVAWREAEHKGRLFDPQHVVIAARETARRLYEIAEQIERRPS